MFKELLHYLWENKKWWLVPPIIIFIIFGILVFVTASSPVSPFIYMLF
jgi:hypothetical protein